MGWFRRARTTALVVVLLLCAACVALVVFDVIQLARAKALIAAFQSLRMGVSWNEQTSAKVFHHSCDPREVCYEEQSISSLPFVDHGRYRSADIPSFLRPRFWAVAASVTRDPAGKVIAKWLMIDDGKYFQFPTISINVASEPRLFDPCLDAHQTRHPGYRSRREQRTGALLLVLSPSADERWIRHAFDLRLDCLGSLRGCKGPSDIASTAWKDMIDDKNFWKTDAASQDRILKSCPL